MAIKKSSKHIFIHTKNHIIENLTNTNSAIKTFLVICSPFVAENSNSTICNLYIINTPYPNTPLCILHVAPILHLAGIYVYIKHLKCIIKRYYAKTHSFKDISFRISLLR